MTAMTATNKPSADPHQPFTVRDLEDMPDDGRRYELIAGRLVVSPAPGFPHQKIGYRLYGVIEAACPEEFDVVGAPFAVHVPADDRNELQPDMVVGRFDDFTEKDLPVAPVLVVEVLSPSSAIYDVNVKRALYEEMGVASYWVIDPEKQSMRVFELDDEGRYQVVAKVADDEPFEAVKPFAVRIVVKELLGRLAR
jgi:Uma2 family endonuclease